MAPRRRAPVVTPSAPAPAPERREVWAPPIIPPPAQSKQRRRPVQLRLASRALYKTSVNVVDGFLLPAESAAWIRYGESAGFVEASHPASRDTAFRDNGRIELWDEDVAARIWQRLQPFVPETVDGWRACGCYEKIRLYRYRAGGQRFGRHVDESGPGTRERTRTAVTVLVYLNGGAAGGDELVGGETVFYRGAAGSSAAARFAPQAGALLWHGHGRHCLVHEALPVAKGTKYVLRTDVLYQRA
jgi:2OG-Fe(II) oxygenase superfamily